MKRNAALYGVMIALALIASYIESLFPLPVPVPGIKLGLANVVVLTSLYLLGALAAIFVSVIRIVLSGFLFGNLSAILYSLGGSLLSLTVMYFLFRTKKFGFMGISVAGGAAHNLGQLIVASWVVENINLFYYFPVLLIAGVLTGAVIGILTGEICKRVSRKEIIS